MTATKAARGRVRDALAQEWSSDPVEDRPVVSDHTAPTDPPTRPTLLVGMVGIDPATVACPAPVRSLSVIAVSPVTSPGAGDDLVDDLVDRVLAALDAVGLSWSDVRRGTFLDSYPSYSVTVEVPE